MDTAQRVDHLDQFFGAVLALVGVQHVRIAVSGLRGEFPQVVVAVPGADQPYGCFVLLVFGLVLFAVVHVEHRYAAPRIEEPSGKAVFVVVAPLPIEFLQQVQVAVRTVFVAFGGVGAVLVALVEVHVREVVLRVGVIETGRGLEFRAAVLHPQEFVVGVETADALDEIEFYAVESLCRFRVERDSTAESSSRDTHRAGPVVEAAAVDEKRRYHREIDHAERRRVELQAVPQHLRVRWGSTPKRCGGEGPASVRFDEYGRVLREDVRHAVDHRFAQRQGIQVGFGGSHVRKRPFTGNRYLLQLHEPFRGLALKRAGPDGGKCHAEYERGSVHVFPQFNALFWLKAIRS